MLDAHLLLAILCFALLLAIDPPNKLIRELALLTIQFIGGAAALRYFNIW